MISKDQFDKGIETPIDDDMKYMSSNDKRQLILNKINHYKGLPSDYGFIGFHTKQKLVVPNTTIRNKTIYWAGKTIIGTPDATRKLEPQKYVPIKKLTDDEFMNQFISAHTLSIRELLSKGQAYTKEEILEALHLKNQTKIEEKALRDILKGVIKKKYDSDKISDTYYFIKVD